MEGYIPQWHLRGTCRFHFSLITFIPNFRLELMMF
jgi:hypothetical protein